MDTQLIGIGYSPWTQKARWALDHHHVPYRYSEHLIMLGMPLLRLKSRQWIGPITAPALLTEHDTLADSFEIAQWAEQHGRGSSLFPEHHRHDITRWNQLSDDILNAGRILTTQALRENDEALLEAVPALLRPLPGSLPLARQGADYVLRKYRVGGDRSRLLQTMRDGLQTFREAIDSNSYVLGEFSVADIIMSVTLQIVEPPSPQHTPLGPESRRCWTRPELVEEFRDLLEWRDELLVKHHRPLSH